MTDFKIETEYNYETNIDVISAFSQIKPLKVIVQLIQTITTTITNHDEEPTVFIDSSIVDSWSFDTKEQGD